MCVDIFTIRFRGFIVIVVFFCFELKIRVINIFRGFVWGVRVGLLEVEVKFEFVDIEEKIGSGYRKKVRFFGF